MLSWMLVPMAWAEPTIIEVQQRIVPVFPAEARALGVTKADCKMKVTIDSRGWATDVEPTDCPTAFITTAVTTLKAWKWAPPTTASGQLVQTASFAETLHFELDPEAVYPDIDESYLSTLRNAHEQSDATGEGCIVGVRMRSDGSIDRLASNDPAHCLAIPNGNVQYLSTARKQSVTCHADFKVVRGQARELSVTWCPAKSASIVDRMLRTWQWLVVGESVVPYHVELTFEPL